MSKTKSYIKSVEDEITKWVHKHYLNLGIFNIILVVLVLLRSAGYFHPYFPISVNFIIMTMLVLSILLLHLNSLVMLIIFIAFWLFAAILKALYIDIWSERTGIYAFQALFLGLVLLIIELIRDKKRVR